MDPDHPRPEERLLVEDAPIDMGFGGEVDDRIDRARRSTSADRRREGADDDRVGDVALDETQPSGLLGICLDRGEIGPVAGVRQLVEDGDARPVAPAEDVADESRSDEPGAAGDEEVRAGPDRRPVCTVRGRAHPTGRSIGRASRPASSSSRASSDARSSDGTVPASVQWPSKTRLKRRPSGM